MSGFWYSDLSQDQPSSVAVGEAPLGEIWSAATNQMRLVENSDASYNALYQAYDERIKAIEARTGERRENPLALAMTEGNGGPRLGQRNPALRDQPQDPAPQVQAFNDWLSGVNDRHPDAADIIKVNVPVERDAEALARFSDERLSKAFASRDGVGKWAAMLAGGMQGSLYDPLQVVTLFVGGGPGAGRTVATRILSTVAKEAAVNSVIEAVQQQAVQDWRKRAGLPNGPEEAFKNIAFAGVLGGAFGGLIGGAGEIARALRGRGEEAARLIADRPETAPNLKAAIDGNPKAAADLLHPIRADLPAEARGAIDNLAADTEISAMRPPAATAARHDEAVTSALQAAQTGSYVLPDPDPDQVARLVDRLVPDTPDVPANVKTGDPTLQQFLMRSGGVQDFKGELDALGLTTTSERFVGKLVKPDGMPLDQARLRAAEAGYFNDLYGTPDEAAAKSTIPDLLDKLDQAQRDTSTTPTVSADRAYAERLVSDIARQAGPAVDDELIIKAAELANAENLNPVEALDRVLMADDAAKEQARFASEPSGMINPEDTRGGLDDPSAISDDMLISARDLAELDDDFEFPFFDDDTSISVRDLKAELEHDDDLIALVEACRA